MVFFVTLGLIIWTWLVLRYSYNRGYNHGLDNGKWITKVEHRQEALHGQALERNDN